MMVVTKGTSKQGQRTRWDEPPHCRLVGLVAVRGVRGAYRIRPLARLPYRRGHSRRSARTRPGPGYCRTNGGALAGVPTVGALIASRLPTNPIGWIFCGMGLLYTARRFTEAYADYALIENFAFPGGEYAAWFSSFVWFAGLLLAGVFLMLLFPDGHLLSRRWRIVAWMAVLGAALTVLWDAFIAGLSVVTHPYVENPFGVVGGHRWRVHNVRVLWSLALPRYDATTSEQSRCAFLALRSAAPRTGR